MSDITNYRKALELMEDGDTLGRAAIHADLAVSRALREIDVTIRQRLSAIETKIGEPAQTWLQWQDEDGYQSIPVGRIIRIKQNGSGTVLVTHDGEISTTLSFMQASLQVGAE